MSDLLGQTAAERRFASQLFNAFAFAALALAAIGIYGLLSGSVTERRREIGVRSALGASRASILRLVIGQAAALTAAGVIIGLGAAFVGSRAIDALLFGVTRLDPVTYLAVITLLAGVALMASSMPAIRAARTLPSVVLSAE
jgi:putative ABC transport system permease protein